MLKAFVTIGILQLLTMILQVVRTKTLAVTLGPEWLGVMGAVDRLTAVIVQTVSLSFPFAAVRFLPRLWTSDREEFRRVLAGMRNVLALTVTVATTAAAALTFVVPRVWGRELAPYGTAVLAATATLPALAFLTFENHAGRGAFGHAGPLLTLVMIGAGPVTTVKDVDEWRSVTGIPA